MDATIAEYGAVLIVLLIFVIAFLLVWKFGTYHPYDQDDENWGKLGVGTEDDIDPHDPTEKGKGGDLK